MSYINFDRNKIHVRKLVSFNILPLLLVLVLVSCKSGNKKPSSSEGFDCQSATKIGLTESNEDGFFEAHQSKSPIIIDGCSNDEIWSKYSWYSMNYNWMGSSVDSTDYQGRFKLAWDTEKLYILVEVIDDYLHPTLSDGKDNYWKGDYVEVFIDEDRSGGDHKFNHQAFAYHVSTEGHAIDKNTLQEAVFFDNHVEVERTQDGNRHLWEMAIKLYDKEFDENSSDNIPVKILNQKSIGFSIAYGDNDGNNNRENFIGSKKTHGNNNDEGYVNSDVFGRILFVE